MAAKSAIYWRLTVVGDGADTTYAATIATAPFVVTDILVPGFDLAAPMPNGVIDLSSSDGQAVTAALSAMNTICTFTWPIAIPAGDIVNVYGKFTYA